VPCHVLQLMILERFHVSDRTGEDDSATHFGADHLAHFVARIHNRDNRFPALLTPVGLKLVGVVPLVGIRH